jgi:biopolymer transport protein ExbD
MDNLFLLLFLVSFIAIIVGLIKPSLVVKWGEEDKKNRKTVFKTYGIILIASFILFGMTTDSTEQTSNQQEPQKEAVQEDVTKYQLTVTIEGKGQTSIDGTTSYQEGTQKQITATPEEGWEFDTWQVEDDNTSATLSDKTITVSVDSDVSVVAKFKESIADINFSDIDDNYENMTDVQFKKYGEGLVGKKVIWSGYVVDVKKQMLSDNYQVYIDMDSPDDFMSVQEVYLKNITEEEAINLRKKQLIKFKGRIKQVADIMTAQITLEEVELLD